MSEVMESAGEAGPARVLDLERILSGTDMPYRRMLAKGAWVEALMWAVYRGEVLLAVGILEEHGIPEDEEVTSMVLNTDQMFVLNLRPGTSNHPSTEPRWSDGFRVLSRLLDEWRVIHASHGGEALHLLIDDFERSGSALEKVAPVAARDLAGATPDATWGQVFKLLAKGAKFRDIGRSAAVFAAILALQRGDIEHAVEVWKVLDAPDPEPDPSFGEVLHKLLVGARPTPSTQEYARRIIEEPVRPDVQTRLGLTSEATNLDGCRAVAARAQDERSRAS